ncbi:16S rRNA (guanine(527)-N(7))-methyltransferase RsmG [Fuchsiella alkaliacetigena]|uniref:16S rRNA (guanine(527)-N(7))-methyltransferase RsmG n=1 Tax=Fuchsiella alkaliacetigena TaxID=957042 RepID=UPI00200A0D65|nr:16S rRNA (guanine(527)-N(7))-methyltransferase RsmG [Fuchsiella alkaliacetigena]MCK8824535.1 16S rRNA (guanine(527)-N(7))-methyltransferase RsmG [Fuchsiella alkaliacetigena]
MNNKELLISGAAELGIKLKEKQVRQFMDYKDFLQEWNQKINLTAIEDDQEIIVKHFLDSLSCLKAMKFLNDKDKLIDVGTGAGFPGLPLKIIYPELKLVLLDSTKKKVSFLRALSRELELQDIEFLHGRAEDYGQDSNYREKFKVGVARAVASLEVLSEYVLPFLKVGAFFIAQKGDAIKDEVIDASRAVEKLGAEFVDVKTVNLPHTEIERSLVIINKIAKTPLDYPRRAGIPKQSPIV